jgi:hypothetical protein
MDNFLKVAVLYRNSLSLGGKINDFGKVQLENDRNNKGSVAPSIEINKKKKYASQSKSN